MNTINECMFRDGMVHVPAVTLWTPIDTLPVNGNNRILHKRHKMQHSKPRINEC